ncbi:MAG: metallophosphoesterase family protein [Saprospiraceae bacterium]|nr:metallophosphoesterase family protein [Saprospiraceae bacterium]
MKIALISDTHFSFEEDVNKYLREVDEIWHAGDIGDLETADKYCVLKPLRAVYGNIDGHEIRTEYPEYIFFNADGINVLMTHIGGYPGRYTPQARSLIEEYKPDLFITGHSHILKIMPDKKYNLLHMNPGSCGTKGYHSIRTLILFDIEASNIENVRVVELAR